jgi:membrane protease YdiL (CAAX protease family)
MLPERIHHEDQMSLARRPTGVLLGVLVCVFVWIFPKLLPFLVGPLLLAVIPGDQFTVVTLLTLAFYGFYLLLLGLWVRYKEERPFHSLGFPARAGWARQAGTGFLIGFAVAALVVGTAVLSDAATVSLPPGGFTVGLLVLALVMLLGFAVQGTAEEALTRGYALQVFRKPLGVVGAVVGQALLFMLSHSGSGLLAPLPVLNLALVGVTLGFWALAQDGLWGVSGFHAAWNWTLAVFFGALTSGFQMPGAVFQLAATPTAGNILSGGSYGLEGSAITTVVMLVLCALAYRAYHRRDVAVGQTSARAAL